MQGFHTLFQIDRHMKEWDSRIGEPMAQSRQSRRLRLPHQRFDIFLIENKYIFIHLYNYAFRMTCSVSELTIHTHTHLIVTVYPGLYWNHQVCRRT